MKNLPKRLDALESAEQARPQIAARFTADLVTIYASDEERAQWEAAGQPACTKAEWEQALNLAYANP